MSEVLVLDACRTPRGRGKPGRGALSEVHPQELLATLLRAIPDRTGLDPAAVDDVVAGVVSQVGEQGANLARLAVLAAGWPDTVPGVTLNRMCGSGLQAVAFAAGAVAAGHAELVAAGGAESLSRVPFLSDGAWLDGRNPALEARLPMAPQGVCADLLAALEGISREELDAFALESQQRAARAIAEKRFAPSLVPVRDASGRVLLAADEHPRPETTAAALAALPPAFAEAASRPPVPGAPPPARPSGPAMRRPATSSPSTPLATRAASSTGPACSSSPRRRPPPGTGCAPGPGSGPAPALPPTRC